MFEGLFSRKAKTEHEADLCEILEEASAARGRALAELHSGSHAQDMRDAETAARERLRKKFGELPVQTQKIVDNFFRTKNETARRADTS